MTRRLCFRDESTGALRRPRGAGRRGHHHPGGAPGAGASPRRPSGGTHPGAVLWAGGRPAPPGAGPRPAQPFQGSALRGGSGTPVRRRPARPPGVHRRASTGLGRRCRLRPVRPQLLRLPGPQTEPPLVGGAECPGPRAGLDAVSASAPPGSSRPPPPAGGACAALRRRPHAGGGRPCLPGGDGSPCTDSPRPTTRRGAHRRGGCPPSPEGGGRVALQPVYPAAGALGCSLVALRQGSMETSVAAAVVIGNEVLNAQVADENGAYLIHRLRERGIGLSSLSVVPDEVEPIVDAVVRARRRARWVFTSGGIGPTHDDVTVRAVALALGRRVVRLPEMLALLEAHYPEVHTPEALRLTEAPEGTQLLHQEGSWYPILACEGVLDRKSV